MCFIVDSKYTVECSLVLLNVLNTGGGSAVSLITLGNNLKKNLSLDFYADQN